MFPDMSSFNTTTLSLVSNGKIVFSKLKSIGNIGWTFQCCKPVLNSYPIFFYYDNQYTWYTLYEIERAFSVNIS